jgi:pilus assembly protein TadC
LSVGVDIWDSQRHTNKRLLINSIISGGISVSLLIFLAGERNVWSIILTFVSFTIVYFLVHLVLRNINKKRQRQIDDELSSDEDIEC